MAVSLRETCQQYVTRRLSEGWRIVWQGGHRLILSSPDGILRPVDLRNDVETLRPNAAGDETTLIKYGAAANWQCVDEATPDEGSTTVATDGDTYSRDLYNLPASSSSGDINFIKIYFRCYKIADYVGNAKPSLKSNSTVTDGTEIGLNYDFTTYSQQWNTNPADDEAWEWADIDALQIGVSLQADAFMPANVECTQVYVEIDYTPSAVDVTIEAVLATVSGASLVPTPSLGRTLSSPVVAINSEAKITTFAIDRIFSAPLVSVNSQSFNPGLTIDRMFDAPLIAITSEALIPDISIGIDILIQALVVAINAEGLSPTLLRDMIFGAPVISVNAEALIPVLYVEGAGWMVIDAPAATIAGEVQIPSWSLGVTIYVPLVEIDSNAIVFHPPTATINSEVYVPSFIRDMIFQSSVAAIDLEALIPELLVLEETVIQAPVVAINAQGLTPNLVRDIIFGVPLSSINTEGPTPILSLSLTLLPPLTSIDAEALASLLSRGIIIESGVIAIDSQSFPPGLSLDRVLIPLLVAIDSQALSPSLSLGKTLLSSLATIGASTPTPSLFPFGRLLVVKVTTSQYRQIRVTTSQYRKVHAIPSMKRKIKITTDGG